MNPFVWFVSAGIGALDHKEKKWDNNHNLVDCCFFFVFSDNPHCQWSLRLSALVNIMLIDLVDRLIWSSKFLACDHCASFALAFEVFIVRRDLHHGQTCHGSLQLSLHSNLLVREPPHDCVRDYHRDRNNCLRNHHHSQSAHSRASLQLEHPFAITIEILVRVTVIATELACSFQCNAHRNWMEQWVVALLCDGLSDQSLTIEFLGLFKHSRAANLSQLCKCNSASWDMLVHGGEGWKQRPLSRGLADCDLTILVWQVQALLCNDLSKTSWVQLGVLQYLGWLRALKGGWRVTPVWTWGEDEGDRHMGYYNSDLRVL